jgi:hypothetical protein
MSSEIKSMVGGAMFKDGIGGLGDGGRRKLAGHHHTMRAGWS